MENTSLLSKGSRAAASAYASITPRDEYNAAYLSFILLGAGFLFPWNAVITAVDYFNGLFPNQNIEFDFTLCYMCPNLFGLIFVVMWGERLTFRFRIIFGFLIFLACIVAMPFITVKWLSLTVVCILGFSDAIVQGSIYGLSGQFHPRYVGAVMSGNGVAGITVSLLRVVTKAAVSGPNSANLSAILYFSLSAAVILGCILCYAFVLERSPVTKFYLGKSRAERSVYISKVSANGQPLSVSGATGFVDNPSAAAAAAGLSMAHDAPGASTADKAMAGSDPEVAGVVSPTAVTGRSPIAVFRDVWPMAFVAFFNFWVTLALFPGITSREPSDHESLNRTGWFPIILITMFNGCDFLGRTAPRWDALVLIKPDYLWIFTTARVIFFAAFILVLKHVINSDLFMYASMILFGLSNGYLGTLAMMYGPARVGVFDKEQAGTVMVFCLTIGLTSGVWTGVLINDLV